MIKDGGSLICSLIILLLSSIALCVIGIRASVMANPSTEQGPSCALCSFSTPTRPTMAAMEDQLKEVRNNFCTRTSNQMRPMRLPQLLQFLHDRNPEARGMALSHLVGHTAVGSQHRSLFLAGIGGGGLNSPSENEVIRDLKLLCRDHPVCPVLVFFFLIPSLIIPGRLLRMMPSKR